MAKTYIQIHPEHRILIVDQVESIGGSWARERLYPGLKTNNVLGSYELSDFPMHPGKYSVDPGCHIPGRAVHEYFLDLAETYGIDSSRLRLQTRVASAALLEDRRWRVELYTREPGTREPRQHFLVAGKIVVGTGLTSEPNIPEFPGQDDFAGLILHSKHLKARSADLGMCRDVVVLGGNKSAWDVCYDAARSGSRVHMVIRPSGGGPSYVWPKSFKVGPVSLALASMSSMRFFAAFDPTLHNSEGSCSWWSRFLHRTSLGNRLCHLFWQLLDRHIRRLNGYDSHPELKKLEPWTSPFWMGNSLSIHNYESNWFDLVREGRIKVHIAEVDFLSKDQVHLSDGDGVTADALVCCTGWKSQSSIRFHESRTSGPVPDSRQLDLELQTAQAEILRQSKYLEKSPKRTSNAPILSLDHKKTQAPVPSSCLYRFMVPWQSDALERHNLAFIGCHSSIHAVVVAQAQALWIVAYFDNKVDHLTDRRRDDAAIRYDAILHGIYGAVRRPRECGGAADKHPDLVFDSIAYVDCLMNDLGVRNRRKGGFWREMFQSHGPKDYKGIVEEWKKAQQSGTK